MFQEDSSLLDVNSSVDPANATSSSLLVPPCRILLKLILQVPFRSQTFSSNNGQEDGLENSSVSYASANICAFSQSCSNRDSKLNVLLVLVDNVLKSPSEMVDLVSSWLVLGMLLFLFLLTPSTSCLICIVNWFEGHDETCRGLFSDCERFMDNTHLLVDLFVLFIFWGFWFGELVEEIITHFFFSSSVMLEINMSMKSSQSNFPFPVVKNLIQVISYSEGHWLSCSHHFPKLPLSLLHWYLGHFLLPEVLVQHHRANNWCSIVITDSVWIH